jgi:integrase/recombinase XerD
VRAALAHSLRYSAITFALDVCTSLRDVRDYAGHKDPLTSRRYDHSRDSLDRNAAVLIWHRLSARVPAVA